MVTYLSARRLLQAAAGCSMLAAASVGWSTPLFAQVPDWVNQILTAAQLPVAASEARRGGVTSNEIRAVLDALLNAGVPAYEATALIDSTRAVRRDHGPVDNFGAFVQSQLAAGKRGPALAAAIRQEHARQGKGNAKRGESDEKPGNRGRNRPPSR